MTISQNNACQRLSALGLRQEQVHQIIDQVQKWASSNGEEWTCARLKELKVGFIKHLAGQSHDYSWIAHTKGVPKGPFKCLFDVDMRNPKHVQRSLCALMVYSSMVSSKPTKTQWEKFRSSVEDPEPSIQRRLPLPCRRKSKGVLEHSGTIVGGLGMLPASPSRRVPVWDKTSQSTKTVPESNIGAWFPDNISNPWMMSTALEHEDLHRFIARGLRVSNRWGEEWTKSFPDNRPGYPGRVSFIHEPGYKLRPIANPNRILQLYLEPLKRILMKSLREINEDCTHDQDKGVKVVQQWLKDGKTVHSVDLSDATNNFPRDVQFQLIDDLMDITRDWVPLKSRIEVCKKACSAPWSVQDPILQEERMIEWKKGQPLGLGPSFGMFALAHHAVMREIMAPGGTYVILGDDIVINDARVASTYIDFVTSRLGCKVSEPKTLVSNKVAEFAGKVITAETVFHPYKWRETSDRNFVDLVRNLGQGFISLLRPRQRDVISKIAEVPEEYGGLGFNPRGLSYLERSNPKHPLVQLDHDRDLLGQRFLPATNVVKREFEFAAKLHLTDFIRPGAGTLFDPAVHSPNVQWNPQGVRLPNQGRVTYAANQEDRPDPSNERDHPTSNPMDSIHRTLDMKRVKQPEGHTNPDYLVDSVSSDPRGLSQLERLERLLKEGPEDLDQVMENLEYGFDLPPEEKSSEQELSEQDVDVEPNTSQGTGFSR